MSHGLRPVWGAFETLNTGTLRTSLTETNGQLRPFVNGRRSHTYDFPCAPTVDVPLSSLIPLRCLVDSSNAALCREAFELQGVMARYDLIG